MSHAAGVAGARPAAVPAAGWDVGRQVAHRAGTDEAADLAATEGAQERR